MRTVAQPRCPNCDANGVVAYAELEDRVYGAPGLWSMQRCCNRRCGAYWLDPAPHPDDLAVAYADYHTHDRDVDRHEPTTLISSVKEAYVARRLGLEARVDWLPRLLSRFAALAYQRSHAALYAHFYLPVKRDGKLLEIGCGAGKQLETMARDGWDARGIDFDPNAVEVARGRGLDVAVGDVRELALREESFDAIVMAQVIEHVFDPVGLLRRCAQLLKPGGRLIAITPNADSLGHRLFGRDWRGLEPPRHIAIFTRRALRLASVRAGLAVERIDVTARDCANLLLASTRIRAANGRALIDRPATDRSPPATLRWLAEVERAAAMFGCPWGEELVLSACKRRGP